MEKHDKGLSAWQLTMMALGCVIGGSFFLGSSVAFKAAGPAIVIAYILGGILVYFILFALSEMTVANPKSGSFYTFTAVYWIGMILAMSSEATAVSILIKEWYPRISIPILGSAIIIVVTLINLLGADKLSKLESSLAIVKVFAVIAFIVIAVLLIVGLIGNHGAIGTGELAHESFMPGGVKSIAGSMLIVIFAYAGFEIIGLAASEAKDPHKSIPRAITYTVISLVGLYIISSAVLLPLLPTTAITGDVSPMVAALSRWGMGWASQIINFVLVTAILSTMLASMFGLGRMMRSIADDGNAPRWLKDKKDIPYHGIIFSGVAMLIGLGLGFLFPNVYLFLISSGGFATLLTYAAIVATHIRYRKCNGCPPNGNCQMPGYPYTSWIALIGIIIIIASMPFIAGQTAGLIAGVIITILFAVIYLIMKKLGKTKVYNKPASRVQLRERFSNEFSEELSSDNLDKNKKASENSDCGCNKDKNK